MAMASTPQSTKKLEELLKCPICLGMLDHPQAFECLHFFCQTCIGGLQPKRWQSDVLECPTCRLPSPKHKLRSMYFVHELLEIVDLAKKEQRYCHKCKSNASSHRCLNCKQNYCKDCKAQHDGFDYLENHKWEKLSDEANPIIDKHVYCTKHEEEPAKLHCKDCDELICILCKGIEHDHHQAETIKDAIERILPGVKKQQDQVQRMITETDSRLTTLKKDREHIGDEYWDIEQRIDAKVEDVIEKVRKDGEMLKSIVNEARTDHMVNIEKCETSLQMQLESHCNIATLAESTISSVQGASLLQALHSGVSESLQAQIARRQENAQYTSTIPMDFSACLATTRNMAGVLIKTPQMVGVLKTPAFDHSMFINHPLMRIDEVGYKGTHMFGYNVSRFGSIYNYLWTTDFNELKQIRIYSSDLVQRNTMTVNDIRSCYRVAQFNENIVLATKNGLFVTKIGSGDLEQILSSEIRDVSVYQNKLFVLNDSSSKLQIYKKERFRYTFEKVDEFDIPYYNSMKENTLQVTQHHIYIALVDLGKIEQYNHNGEHVASHKPEEYDTRWKNKSRSKSKLLGPRICGVDGEGTLLIADWGNGCLKLLSMVGSWKCLNVENLKMPRYAVIRNNTLLVKDYEGLKEYRIY